jgi:hypothetical protein
MYLFDTISGDYLRRAAGFPQHWAEGTDETPAGDCDQQQPFQLVEVSDGKSRRSVSRNRKGGWNCALQ